MPTRLQSTYYNNTNEKEIRSLAFFISIYKPTIQTYCVHSGPAQEKTVKKKIKSQNIHKLGNSFLQYFITSNQTIFHAVKQWL